MDLLITGPQGEQTVKLHKKKNSIGRSKDSDIVLSDFSVSRSHAFLYEEEGVWFIEDNKSTNGIFLNGKKVQKAKVEVGDEVRLGNFKLELIHTTQVASGTFFRTLHDFQLDYQLDSFPKEEEKELTVEEKRKSKVLSILVQMAKILLEVESLDEVLNKIMEIVFEALDAERGYILLKTNGNLEPKLIRSKKGTLTKDDMPFSKTIIDQVINQKISLITHDALADSRFEEGKSIKIHQIRSALCAPLWNKDRVIGMIYVDSPSKAGIFSMEDLDLLTALANMAAVSLERAILTQKFKEEERIKNQLARYHSPSIVDEIIKGKERTSSSLNASIVSNLTVFFADIVKFTNFTEKTSPLELMSFLNNFFSIATECIFEEGGTLDKFIGDAVMAFFGAPIAQKDHADRAVRCAIKLQKALKEWNIKKEKKGEMPLLLRIGIHSGNAIVGNFGSVKRLEYTALGSTVNIASRLEEYVADPGQIVISDDCKKVLKDKYNLVNLGKIPLKGLTIEIPVWLVKYEE